MKQNFKYFSFPECYEFSSDAMGMFLESLKEFCRNCSDGDVLVLRTKSEGVFQFFNESTLDELISYSLIRENIEFFFRDLFNILFTLKSASFPSVFIAEKDLNWEMALFASAVNYRVRLGAIKFIESPFPKGKASLPLINPEGSFLHDTFIDYSDLTKVFFNYKFETRSLDPDFLETFFVNSDLLPRFPREQKIFNLGRGYVKFPKIGSTLERQIASQLEFNQWLKKSHSSKLSEKIGLVSYGLSRQFFDMLTAGGLQSARRKHVPLRNNFIVDCSQSLFPVDLIIAMIKNDINIFVRSHEASELKDYMRYLKFTYKNTSAGGDKTKWAERVFWFIDSRANNFFDTLQCSENNRLLAMGDWGRQEFKVIDILENEIILEVEAEGLKKRDISNFGFAQMYFTPGHEGYFLSEMILLYVYRKIFGLALKMKIGLYEVFPLLRNLGWSRLADDHRWESFLHGFLHENIEHKVNSFGFPPDEQEKLCQFSLKADRINIDDRLVEAKAKPKYSLLVLQKILESQLGYGICELRSYLFDKSITVTSLTGQNDIKFLSQFILQSLGIAAQYQKFFHRFERQYSRSYTSSQLLLL